MASGILERQPYEILGHVFYSNDYPSKKYAVFDFNITYDISDHSNVYFKATNFTNQSYKYDLLQYDYSEHARFFIAGAQFKF